MKVIVQMPRGEPRVLDIKGDLKSMQDLVEGYIEHIVTPMMSLGVHLWANEEGRIKLLTLNEPVTRNVYPGGIFGNAVFTGLHKGEPCALTKEQIHYVLDKLAH